VITIQNTLEEKRKVAMQEADAILTDARQKATDELQGSREQLARLRSEIQVLESQKMQFFVRFRNLLRSQAQVLDAMMDAEEKEMPPAEPPPAPHPRGPSADPLETRWARNA
jgi:septal ring factor EnvC (AmiA/AmiB activator)